MAENTWQGSIESGVLRNHWLSQQIWYSAVEDSIMMDHAMMVDGFGLHSGESANLTRMHALAEPSDATLIETQRIPEDLVRFTAKPIVIKEMGRAVPPCQADRIDGHRRRGCLYSGHSRHPR